MAEFRCVKVQDGEVTAFQLSGEPESYQSNGHYVVPVPGGEVHVYDDGSVLYFEDEAEEGVYLRRG